MAGKVITSEELARLSAAPDFVRQGYFSPAVQAGPFVYISGTAAQDRSKDVRGQTREVFDYMARVLAEVGYGLSDIVKIQAFVTTVEDYGGYNEVRRSYFPHHPPASTSVVTALLFPGMLVEVEAVAYKAP